jgi:osmotically-inducible protein OsmY
MLQRLSMLFSAAGLIMTVACAQSDPGITTAVKTKLAADDTVKAYQIDVDTANGVVTLSGNVETAAAKDQAVILARGTEGVTDVVDHITVSAATATTPGHIGDDIKDATKTAGEKVGDAAETTGEVITDAAITTAVKAKLLADTETPGMKIDVDTKDGVVTLSGSVSSAAASAKAAAEAADIKGVKRVVNNLRIAA